MRATRTIVIHIIVVGLLAGSAIGAAAQDEEPPLSQGFTGSFTTQLDVLSGGTWTETPGLGETDGFAYRGSMVWDDPRLTGTFTYTGNWLIDTRAGMRDDGLGNVVSAATYELMNDDGSWIGEQISVSNFAEEYSSGIVVFVGQGGYDGLTATAAIDFSVSPARFVGTIFPRPMPDFPEPYTAE